MAWYLVFWRNRSTATVVPAASASQARSRAQRQQKRGYGAIVAASRANDQDARLIRRGVWVRRRRDGSPPSSIMLAPSPGPGSSAAVIGGGWVLMVDAAIELAVRICPKAEQVAELTATLKIRSGP
jgi:hypothetical protein